MIIIIFPYYMSAVFTEVKYEDHNRHYLSIALVVGVKSLPQLNFPHTQNYNESIPVPGDNETLLSWETENALSLLSADEKQNMIDECVQALVS